MINILIIIGFVANLAAYSNFYSTILFIIIWAISNLTIRFCFPGSKSNTPKEISILIISLIYFFSGIIEVLIVQGFDPAGIDATKYFKAASDAQWDFRSYISEGLSSGYTADSIIGLKEDFLPILIWNKIYNLFYSIGFPKGRYIGIASNTLFLVWTSFIGLSILRSIKVLQNTTTEKYYKLLFCSNSIFWMYGSIHIRESIIALVISILTKVWIDWIHKNSFFNLIKLGIISTIFYLSAGFLRGGYQNILILFLSSFLILELYKILIERRIKLRQFVFFLILVIALIIRYENFNEIYLSFQERFLTYNSISNSESSVDSFGRVLVNQPLLIRTFLSGFFVLIMPIPFWAGQETQFSLYHFFKASFALYNYFTIPLLVIVIKDSLKNFKKIELDKLFLLTLLIQIILFIGVTSVDSRHFGNFGIIYVITICYVNFKRREIKENYKYLLGYLFLLIFLLYLIYSVLKFQSLYLSIIFILVPIIILFFISKEVKK